MEAGVSIIICCYNSASRLPATLKHIAMQKISKDLQYEVVIVDNNSNDSTAQTARIEWSKYNTITPLYIVEEKKPGLSHARERGIVNAKYDVIIFCDDDNWLDENYVMNAYRTISLNPKIGIVGGDNEAVTDVEFPYWFNELQSEYACGSQGTNEGFTDRLYIWGAGMVIRKEVFDKIRDNKLISQLSDRKGAELSSGGDSELCFMCIVVGYKLFYSPTLKLKHFIPVNRLKWDYVLRLMIGHAKASYKLMYYWDMITGKKYNKSWLISLVDMSKFLFNRRGLYSIYHYIKARKMETDRFSLMAMRDFQLWLEHFNNINSHSAFLSYLDKASVVYDLYNKKV